LASDDHAEAVAAFYREVWDPTATAASVLEATRRAAAANVAAPGEAPPTVIVLEGDRVIGYCGSIPQRLWDGVSERPAYWVKGLMVLPEFRNGPIGFHVVKELIRHLPCSTILTVAPAAKRLFGALGSKDLGAVPNWVRPLRAGVMANRLDLDALGLASLPQWVRTGVSISRRTGIAGVAAAGAGVGVAAAAAIMRMSAAGLQTAVKIPEPGELDSLWADAKVELAASPVRDATYLLNRFGPGSPEADAYLFVETRDRGKLVGVAAVRRPRETSDPRLGGIRVATISDVVFNPLRRDVGLATLGGIERLARQSQADAVVCMSSHPRLGALLRRQGYLRLSGNVHFFLRDETGRSPWPSDLSSWWLARGDGESDATF
jgi:GNAT superfamily N-acetyltransferase